jgi:hypothetical protein
MSIPFALRRARIEASRYELLQRASLLDESDRLLVKQVLDRGARIGHLARVGGRSPRALQRHVRRILLRLADPRTVHLMNQSHKWTPLYRAVALRVWVRGHSLRKTATELDLSYHDVRRCAAIARGMLEAHDRRPAQALSRAEGKGRSLHGR